jgi:hypothetical protein
VARTKMAAGVEGMIGPVQPRLHAGECLVSAAVDQLLISSNSWSTANESGFVVDVSVYRLLPGLARRDEDLCPVTERTVIGVSRTKARRG